MLKKIMAKRSIIKEHSSDTTTLDEVGGKNGTCMCVLLMQVSLLRLMGGTGKGAAFEHFCYPLSGEFDFKFCPMLWTFEFDHAED